MQTQWDDDDPGEPTPASLARWIGSVVLALAPYGLFWLHLNTGATWQAVAAAILAWPAAWFAGAFVRDVFHGPPPGITAGTFRNARVARLVGVSVVGVALAGWWFALGRAVGGPLGVVTSAMFASSLIPAMASFTLADKRGRREVIAADWRLCLRCRYPLVDNAASGRLECPECGASGTPDRIERSWRWSYRDSAMLVTPAGTPPDVVRGKLRPPEALVWWTSVPLGIVSGLLALVVVSILVEDLLSATALVAFPLAGGSGFALPIAVGHFWLNRQIARVVRKDYRLCLFCRGALRPDAALNEWRCQDCDAIWSNATLRRSWRWTYRQREEPTRM